MKERHIEDKASREMLEGRCLLCSEEKLVIVIAARGYNELAFDGPGQFVSSFLVQLFGKDPTATGSRCEN